MNFSVIQVLAVLACVLLSTSSKIDKVKPRWIFNDHKHNSKSLPDSIEFDLELESGKVTLNLIKQSTGSFEPPLIITDLQGQSSSLKLNKEFTGTYKDPSFDASATVTIKKMDGTKETYYMITFIHDDKAISLGPRAIFINDPLVNDAKRDNEMKTNLLNVDGVLHSVFESPSIELVQRRSMEEDNVEDELKDTRIKKRYASTNLKKRLLTIEIFTMMDYSIYRKFFEESKATTDEKRSEDAVKTIIFIFTHIMEKVKNIFERIEIKHLKFTTKWIGTFVSKNADDFPYIENALINDHTIDDDAYVNMSRWIFDLKKNPSDKFKFPKYDFLAQFTSYKMLFNESETLGRTQRAEICKRFSHALIRYNRFFVTVTTMAHELGHSLGMYHDGPRNCDASNNIMSSPVKLENHTNDDLHKSYFFSECSLNYTIMNVEKLDERKINCLTNEGNDFRIPETDLFFELFPGQIFDPNDQCRIVNGPDSLYEGGEEDLCQVLRCTKGQNLGALDGTPCSVGAWCRRGICKKDRRAPKSPDRCIYGDYKLTFENPNSVLKKNVRCRDANKNPELCKWKKFKERCCASCAGNPIKNGGCQDIIKKCRDLKPRDCYYGYYATACCKTCSSLVQNSSNVNCLYGDKITDCSDLVPEICHLPSQSCCQTCARYLSQKKNTHPDSCEGDFHGTLSCQGVWGKPLLGDCKSLVNHNPSFCSDRIFKKYCCTSCSGVEDYCKSDLGLVKYNTSQNSCRELVEHNPSLCVTQTMKDRCCKSCGRLTIRPSKFK